MNDDSRSLPNSLNLKGIQQRDIKNHKKFLDVYRFNEAVYAANQENIESLNKSFEESESVALLEADSTFDWQFLNDWLAKTYCKS